MEYVKVYQSKKVKIYITPRNSPTGPDITFKHNQNIP